MKKYEMMYILRASLDEESRKAVMEKLHKILTDNGAKICTVKGENGEQVPAINEWGLRDFAYPIKDETKGYYVVLKMESTAEANNEFTRLANINPDLLRHMIVVDQD